MKSYSASCMVSLVLFYSPSLHSAAARVIAISLSLSTILYMCVYIYSYNSSMFWSLINVSRNLYKNEFNAQHLNAPPRRNTETTQLEFVMFVVYFPMTISQQRSCGWTQEQDRHSYWQVRFLDYLSIYRRCTKQPFWRI